MQRQLRSAAHRDATVLLLALLLNEASGTCVGSLSTRLLDLGRHGVALVSGQRCVRLLPSRLHVRVCRHLRTARRNDLVV